MRLSVIHYFLVYSRQLFIFIAYCTSLNSKGFLFVAFTSVIFSFFYFGPELKNPFFIPPNYSFFLVLATCTVNFSTCFSTFLSSSCCLVQSQMCLTLGLVQSSEDEVVGFWVYFNVLRSSQQSSRAGIQSSDIFSQLQLIYIESQFKYRKNSILKTQTIAYLRTNEGYNMQTKSHTDSSQTDSPGEVFKFPLSNQGIQSFPSISQMKAAYVQLFDNAYGNHPTIKWTFYFVRTKLWKQLNRKYKQKMQQIWKMRCNVCTSIIIYGRRSGLKEYFLLSVNYYHMHTTNINKYINHLKYNDKFRYIVRSFDNHVDSNADQKTILEFMRNLPPNILKATAYWVVNKYFAISEKYFSYLLKKVNAKKQLSFRELYRKLKQQGCEVSYLPKHLLSSHYDDTNYSEDLAPEEIRDKLHPHLPNVLIIVTPQMKQEYKAFGQWVGFDLTFSVVSERTQDNGEYMLGVFAGINSSKKIVIFGLVVTNSQSSFAYSFLFKQFFKIMCSVPDIIITDEQKAIYHSLRYLKRQGIFTGHHLFDMFHMLRKFRKRSYESQTFQLIRKLIHSKDRLQYRSIMKTLKDGIVNDKELDLLRNFDLNCEYYCYAQTPPKFTGIGISNNINEYFHSQIKNEIRHATKLTKSVQIVLDLISRRIELSRKALVTQHSIEGFLNMPFMKPFKSSVSLRTFNYMLRQVTQSSVLRILTLEEELTRNYSSEVSFQQLNRLKAMKRKQYYVQSQFGVYLVEFKRNAADLWSEQKYGRWACNCEHTSRCGYPCSHLSKILTLLNLDFRPYIHKRWLLDPAAVQAFLQDSQSKIKLKKRYQKNIHKDQSEQIEHFDIDGYKNYNKMHQKSKEKEADPNAKKAEHINMQMQLQTVQDCEEDTKDFTEDIFDYEESIVEKEVQNVVINLVEPPEYEEMIDLSKKHYNNHHLIEAGKVRNYNGIINNVQKTERSRLQTTLLRRGRPNK